MPDYAPCKTVDDDLSHLYPSADADQSLCGKPVTTTDPHPDDGKPCPACGKRLLKRIFQLGGPDGIQTVRVTVVS